MLVWARLDRAKLGHAGLEACGISPVVMRRMVVTRGSQVSAQSIGEPEGLATVLRVGNKHGQCLLYGDRCAL